MIDTVRVATRWNRYWAAPARWAGRLRARSAVTARLRELSPLRRWRDKSIWDLLGLDPLTLLQAGKLSLASGLSWALAQWWLGSPSPIWAPLTAALIAMLTIRATIRDATQRVFAIVLGMAVALWLGSLIGLHAWSIAVIAGLGFLVGKVLRLIPAAAAQIPVNGLFILALGSGQSVQRVLDTLIGAGVAVVVNLVVLPPNHVNAARRAVGELSEQVVDLLSEMAGGLAKTWRLDQAASWLREARAHAAQSTVADTVVGQATESLRLHPNRSTWELGLARLRQANRTLHTVEIQVRVLARTLRDIAEDLPSERGVQPPMPMASDMLTTVAGAVSAFTDELLTPEREPDPGGASTARAAIDRARGSIGEITTDLQDLVAANISRGIYLGTLVVETGRIVDEIEAGLNAIGRPDEPPPMQDLDRLP